MTGLQYDGHSWIPDADLFVAANGRYGPPARWQGVQFGGTSACLLLGPDITKQVNRPSNPPTARGPGWDIPWRHLNAPPLHFTMDAGPRWVRGHLINGYWGGSGFNWCNLVALTTVANRNHATIETRLNRYLTEFYRFDRRHRGKVAYWYCIQYWVQASRTPWAILATSNNLYSYCPNLIRVTWRIVRVTKPVGQPGWSIRKFKTQFPKLLAAQTTTPNLVQATNAQLQRDFPGFRLPRIHATLRNTPRNRAENQRPAANPLFPTPAGRPAIPPAVSLLDGSAAVFQD
ncbi:hypothetical protein BC777_1790 [Yoonia maricola]|uniref:Uncharacterized protein n=1 Tax=Yoonia maricola TaxID=420999 RepID=A0A2M8WPS2_9RHOB|nr:hypothetical protein BC777_1790 [Yoonia maricola]